MTKASEAILVNNLHTGNSLEEQLIIDSRRVYNIMVLAAIVIFPIFAIFDLYTLPSNYYWPVTTVRLSITAALIICFLLQKKHLFHPIYIGYFSFISISWFCSVVPAIGGREHLYQHNIANCTVYLAASLFLLWHWKHSIYVIASSMVIYFWAVVSLAPFPLSTAMLEGGSMLVTIMVLHPAIIWYRYNAYCREYYLKQTLAEANELLKNQNLAEERRSKELFEAREQLNKANEELKRANGRLEKLVDSRTKSLEETNSDLKEALAELDSFLYSSYHDLKGPIARLKGLAQLALQDVQDEKAHLYQRMFLNTVLDMERLMEKLNKVNMLYLHKVKKESVDTKQYIEEVLKNYRHTLGDEVLEVSLKGEENFFADKELLKPVIHNLIENAIQFRSKERPLKISLQIENSEGRTTISILDNGSGISDKVLPNIFTMFYRGNVDSKGHGLGLYLSKKAIEKQEGTILVESREGDYTRVVITL